MNNNGLSLLRHFYDLGYDSKLLLYSNDGVDDHSHFSWTNDTWNTKKWAPRVYRTEIVNGHIQSLNLNLISHTLFYIAHKFFKYFKLPGKHFLDPGVFKPGAYIDSLFSDFDIIIASGIAPALFTLSQKKIDIYYPYSTGIEFYKSPSSTTNLYSGGLYMLPVKHIINKVKEKQSFGISQVKQVYNAELSLTKDSLDSIRKNFKILPIPLLYNEIIPKKTNKVVSSILKQIRPENFNIIMTSRQFWVSPKQGDNEWETNQSKRNYILFDGLVKLKTVFPEKKIKLFIVEYGKDVDETKKYLSKIKLTKNVRWIPKLSRKELMIILNKIDVSVGEFYLKQGTIWGGTAMEAMSLGKPFLNSFNFNGNFEHFFKFESPPILNSNNSQEVYNHLRNLIIDREYYDLISKKSLEWYNNNSGKSLAKKWIDNVVN